MKCIRLSYQNPNREDPDNIAVLYGIILEDTPDFVKIKTARREHYIAKHLILTISDTDKTFYEEIA